MIHTILLFTLNIMIFINIVRNLSSFFKNSTNLIYIQLGCLFVSLVIYIPVMLFTIYLSFYHVWLFFTFKSTYKHILEQRQREMDKDMGVSSSKKSARASIKLTANEINKKFNEIFSDASSNVDEQPQVTLENDKEFDKINRGSTMAQSANPFNKRPN